MASSSLIPSQSREELRFALDHGKDPQFITEEKKDELLELLDDFPPILPSQSEPSEVGQEALWVEKDLDLDTSPNGSAMSTKGFVSGDSHHIVLLPSEKPADNTPIQSLHISTSTLKELSVEIEAVRNLLDQALAAETTKSAELAKLAYERATGARFSMERVTPELEALVKEACVKGCEEVMKAIGSGDAEDHASRARSLLDFILPPPDSVILKSPAVSSLGFDNTYVGKGGSKEFDVLSMSSLNEILDGPIEEGPTPVLQHRIYKEVVETPQINQMKEKKTGLFGGMFHRKNKASASDETQSKHEEKKLAEIKEDLSKDSKEATKTTSAILEHTVVLVDETQGHVFERSCGSEDSSDALEKLKDIDAELNRRLKEAMEMEVSESLMSFHGVPNHGKNGVNSESVKSKKAKRNKASKKKEEVDGEIKSTPKRDFDKQKPMFVAAPKGSPGILTSKSWDSLLSDEDEAERVKKILDENMVAVEEQSPSIPPSSPSSQRDDRYAVSSECDRYKVDLDDTDDCAVWKECAPTGLQVVHPAETCSTLGMSSCLDPSLDEREVLEELHGDKYAAVPDEEKQDEGIEQCFVTKQRREARPVEATPAHANKNGKKGVLSGVLASFRKAGTNTSKAKENASNMKPATKAAKTPSKQYLPDSQSAPANGGKGDELKPVSKQPALGDVRNGIVSEESQAISNGDESTLILSVAPPVRSVNSSSSTKPPMKTMQPRRKETKKSAKKPILGLFKPKANGYTGDKVNRPKSSPCVAKSEREATKVEQLTNPETQVMKADADTLQNVQEPEMEPAMEINADNQVEEASTITDNEQAEVERESIEEDPLVASILEQKRRNNRRGIDPTTVQPEIVSRRGIDP